MLLTRQWRDTPAGVELIFWARAESGPIRIVVTGQEAVCFAVRGSVAREELPARREPLELKTLAGASVDGLYFDSQRALNAARREVRRDGVHLYESELKPSDRFLMERFVTAGLKVEGSFTEHAGFREYKNPRVSGAEYRPDLTVLSLDIETSGYEDDLYSICGTAGDQAHVFVVRSDSWETMALSEPALEDVEHSVHRDERALLEAFLVWLADIDPDVIIGWNVVDFDLRFLERCCSRWELPFAFGRGRDRAALLHPTGPGGKRVPRLPGRAVLDGIDTMRTATWSFEDFGLNAVARELLGRSKLVEEESHDKIAAIQKLYREAPWDLLRYNLEDCRLVEDIFAHAGLIEFAIERAQLTGLALDRVGGAVAAFDNLYLPRLHRMGRVAPDVGEAVEVDDEGASPGGFVMGSEPGLFSNVAVLDFKSLYPSIIRSFLVDPLGLHVDDDDPEGRVEGFRGASFSREKHILPGLIEHLWSARDRAKQAGQEPTSRAIKIIMNSFYGVLGTSACRFFDPRLVSSITLRGHEILSESRAFIEGRGLSVIYGDTDSLFVRLDEEASEKECQEASLGLARELTAYWSDKLTREWRLGSCLEVELEKVYVKFFMPTIRGSETGSKKRYAGLVRGEDGLQLSFTGLESVRSDWTPLAREFQREIYRRVFYDEPVEDYVKSTADDLFAGRRDEALVYRKRVRRRLEDYVKNVPPHVQAARKSKRRERFVRYVITTSGPEPIDDNPSPLDYQHYLDRQLAPAADALLQVIGTSVSRILDAQLSLF